MASQQLTELEKDEYYRQAFHRTRSEEWANGISHMVGVVFGIVALTMMVIFSSLRGNAWHVTSCSIYGATLIMLTMSSTLYHLIVNFKAKRFFQILDHCTIYFLIAGTYTPFSLVTLHESKGWTIFGIVWGLTVVGVIIESLFPKLVKYFSLPIYLIMGWIIVIDFNSVISNMDLGGLVMLVAGGMAYTIGVIFYVMDKTPYMHTIWHLFVLGGNVCHWVCVMFYVIPWE